MIILEGTINSSVRLMIILEGTINRADGLCKAIPPNWIKMMKGKLQPPSNKSISMDRIPFEKLSCKLATNFFVERKFVPATAKKDSEKLI